MSNTPTCPKCRGPVVPLEDKLYRCDSCKMLTDCEDDGTVGRGRPEKNAMRNEEFQNRQEARKRRQRQTRLKGGLE